MLDVIITFIKGLPLYLFHIVEIMVVGVLFTAACLFLFGLFVGIRIIGRRANKIEEISFFPPKITFKVDDE